MEDNFKIPINQHKKDLQAEACAPKVKTAT